MANAASFAAEPGKRVAAALIDVFLVSVVAYTAVLGADRLGYESDFASLIAICYFFYQVAFLSLWEGQSPGRRTMDISVISAGGSRLSPLQIVLRSAIRPICCFSPEKILKSGLFQIDPLYTTAVIVVVLVLLAFVPARRTVADLIAGAIVVNTPPPQPHRAPAVPMYSTGDAEFGYPPRKRPEDRGGSK